MIDIAQGNEKALEVQRRGQSARKPGGLLHEPERLFVGPRVQQSICEADRSVDLCPAGPALVRECECLAATTNALLYLPGMLLYDGQDRPALSFYRAIRQRLGERRTTHKGWQ